MNALSHHPGLTKSLRYLAAYVLLAVFVLLGLAITWGLRSDVLIFCLIFHLEDWVANIVERWGIFVILLPWILAIPLLEHYMNSAAKNNLVRQKALKVLAIEGACALVVLVIMGILAVSGYLPIL